MDYLEIYQNYPEFFCKTPFVLPDDARENIQKLVKICNRIFNDEHYEKSLSLKRKLPTRGVLTSFDFHLTETYPQLIEINTNAGGAFLNVALLKGENKIKEMEKLILKLERMFQNEWERWGESKKLTHLAIVDEHPKEQFLYPEFLIAQDLFLKQNIKTTIADPKDFIISNNQLYLNGNKVDFVYNRLTDFLLEKEENQILKTAYENNWACFSPAPEHYQLLAQKNNLLILRDENNFEKWGLNNEEQDILKKMIPPIFKVDSLDFWHNKKHYFFKPFNGFGSKAVYKGEKLTQKTFQFILENHYLAQKLITPSTQTVEINGEKIMMKADVRAYVDGDEILLFAARLYQGQTTNFRTRGGGFALCV